MCKLAGKRGLGACLPENLEAMRLLLRPFLGQTMLLGDQTTKFDMHEYLPFLPVAPYS